MASDEEINANLADQRAAREAAEKAQAAKMAKEHADMEARIAARAKADNDKS